MTNKKSAINVIVISFIYLLLLSLRFYQTKPPEYPMGKEIIIRGTLSEEPQIRGKTQRFSFNSVSIVTWNLPEFHYGERLRVIGTITKEQKRVRLSSGLWVEGKDEDKGRSVMLFPEIALVEHTAGGWEGKIITLRERVIEFYQRSLPTPAAGLLSGVVLGIKANLPSDFYDNLKNTGTMHVVAASGMNVTLVAGFLMSVFLRFFGRRRALILSSLGIIFYAALAGFSASIVRASIMGFLFFLSQYLGRPNFGLLSLGLASGVMILINPQVVTDIGFQLSVCATVGLIIIQPRLKRFTTRVPFVSEALSTTLAAQIATLPILLVNFGRLSLWSLVVNALILWTVEPIMVFGGIGAIAGLVFEPIGRILVYLSYGFLVLFIEVVNFFGKIQLFSFSFENIPILFGVGWYLLLGSILFSSRCHSERSEESLDFARDKSSEARNRTVPGEA